MIYVERNSTIGGGKSDFSSPYPSYSTYYDDINPLEELQNARTGRSGYYKRMENSRRSPLMLDSLQNDVSSTEVVREKGISDGGISDATLPRVPEPHPSWRFYTSYDNGEWKRHMVPVYHDEKDVLNTSPNIGPRSPMKSENSFSFEANSPSIEGSFRRMRISRPSTYDCIQNRRQRLSSGYKRFQSPRSAETILNSIDYMPVGAYKKSLAINTYSPRRRTEYGDKVIYPRVKSDSMSSGDSGFKKLSSNVREEDEVTRSVHPSCVQLEQSQFQEVKAEGRRFPHNDITNEKIIIPTKYKQGYNSATKPAKSILEIADHPVLPHLDRSIRRRTPSPSPRYSNISSYQISNNDSRSSQGRSRSRDSTLNARTPLEADREIKVQLVKPSINENVTTVRTGFQPYKTNDETSGLKIIVPRVRSEFNKQTFDHTDHRGQPSDNSQHQPYDNQNSYRKNLENMVKANTMSTVRQMQDRMMYDIKQACPEASDTIESLLSGKLVEGGRIESKQLTLEQTNNWQKGRPLEGKVTREARVFTNDSLSGPQDFVERSSICQDLSEIPDAGSFIDNPFLQMNAHISNNSLPLENNNISRYPSVFYTPEPWNSQNQTAYKEIKPRQTYHTDASNKTAHKYNVNNRQADNSSNNSSHNFVYAPERVESQPFQEKIIIPTKYKTQQENTSSNVVREGSRVIRGVTSPSTDLPDGGPLVSSGQSRIVSIERPSLQEETSLGDRRDRSNFNFNSVRKSRGGNDWSYEIALNEHL